MTDNLTLQCQKERKPTVSIIIATYKRGHLLNHVLDALTAQTIEDFEVLTIVKPSGDGTEQVIAQYHERLKIKVIIQNHGYVTDALNLGLKNVEGEIIVLLDDDAIPFPNFVQSYILSYASPEVGGVAGDVIPVTLNGNKICPLAATPSEIVRPAALENTFVRKLRNCPLKGLENYFLYISKAGVLYFNHKVSGKASIQIVDSLLAKGANLSFSLKASAGFQFPTSCIIGLTFEQYLGWFLWKKGYRVLFNPEIKVYHINHGQSLSRNIKDAKKEALFCAEEKLLFYRLYGDEPELSMMYRLVWLLLDVMLDIKNICLYKKTSCIRMAKNKFFAELIGLRWLICKKLGSNYSPLVDLEKMLK
jgi:glycosyltransferase involved in cell wall biosynthesis